MQVPRCCGVSAWKDLPWQGQRVLWPGSCRDGNVLALSQVQWEQHKAQQQQQQLEQRLEELLSPGRVSGENLLLPPKESASGTQEMASQSSQSSGPSSVQSDLANGMVFQGLPVAEAAEGLCWGQRGAGSGVQGAGCHVPGAWRGACWKGH